MLLNCHHVKVMKLALAIAIIHQKPKGFTVQLYIKKLSLIASQPQMDWKSKAESLSKELLELKQNILLTEIVPTAAVVSNDDNIQMIWQQSKLNGEGTNPAHDHSQSLFTVDMWKHIQFIKYVSLIKHSSSIIDVSETIKDSIIYALNGITSTICEERYSLCVTSDTLDSSIDIVLGVLTDDRLDCYRKVFLETCSQLNTAAINKLTKGSCVTNSDFKTLQLVIKRLSILKELYVDSLTRLVKFISDSIDQLTEDTFLLNPDCINNLGASLCCIELLIVKPHHQIPLNVLDPFIVAIESNLFKVDQVLPLVGYSVWRIHALMVNCIS